MRVAVIPARGGSKRIPGKNIKPFCGKPMIAYAIEAAQAAGVFDRILVSTDSDEIAALAEKLGAEAPFRRPAELANDHAVTADVLLHSLKWLETNGTVPEVFACIYATNPFLHARYLREGLETMQKLRAPAAFSVTSFPSAVQRALQILPDGTLAMLWPENELRRSNDLTPAYFDAGQFYWFETERFLREKKAWPPGAVPVILPRILVQDIDTPEDWENAERMFRFLEANPSASP